MKILIIEATAEELRASRTVIDNVNEVLNNFTSSLFGIDNIDYSKAYESTSDEQEGEQE